MIILKNNKMLKERERERESFNPRTTTQVIPRVFGVRPQTKNCRLKEGSQFGLAE